MTPEGRIKAKVNKLLKEPWLVDKLWYFMPVQRGFGKPTLDYILCVNGYFVAVETKKDARSTLTDRQKSTMRAMVQAGGRAHVVYDADTLQHLHECLRELSGVGAGCDDAPERQAA